MSENGRRPFTIVQISDLHCGGQYFVPDLLERAISEINELRPDVVVCSGDLTTFGFKEEYHVAKGYLDRLHCEAFCVIPGNHDSRNVGYVHFEELFGERNSVLRLGPVAIVAVDSTEPDLDNGQIGRGRYRWIEEQFADVDAKLKIFVCHHHLLPVPGTGRERNVIYDAGDTIECLQRAGVNLVLSGHKHVPYAWRLENLFVVNTEGNATIVTTPPVEAGILEGVTRDIVLELASTLGYMVRQGNLTRHDLYVADEIFLTGTGAEVVPVARIDGRPVGGGKPGPVTNRLISAYRQVTEQAPED